MSPMIDGVQFNGDHDLGKEPMMSFVKAGRAVLFAVAIFTTSTIVASPVGALPTIPPIPDLAEYSTVPALTDDSGTYFRTAEGLHCQMTADTVECVGPLPGIGVAANSIGLGSSVSAAGAGYGGSIPGVRLIDASAGSFVDKVGDAPPVLRPGEKVVTGGNECAVATGERTLCTIGHPVREWLVVSAAGTGIGPATPGLPSGYPDPVTFVQGHVATANVRFPSYFTVDGPAGELDCEMGFGAVALGCDGPLPGTDANEVYVEAGGGVKLMPTDAPRFRGPTNMSRAKLPAGYATPYPGACVATGGGVACYHGTDNGTSMHGFKVDAAGVTTF